MLRIIIPDYEKDKMVFSLEKDQGTFPTGKVFNNNEGIIRR